MRRRHLAFGLLALAFFPDPGIARTWSINVDGSGDAFTIQAGIDSASVGDTVLVHPGTYAEVLHYRDKDLVVRSAQGPGVTVIDASGLALTAVYIGRNLTRAAAFQGFTVTGAGRGILMFDSEPAVIGNVVEMNDSGIGSGISGVSVKVGPWSPLVQGNLVRGNFASTASSGIGFELGMSPEVLDNEVIMNTAGIGDGGGIHLLTQCNGSVIRGNRIVANMVGDHGGGIHIGSLAGPIELEISGNLIWNNRAGGRSRTGGSGGGIWARETNAWIHHNTIVENTGLGPTDDYGGGIVLQEPGSPVVEQNILAFMKAGAAIRCYAGVTPIIRNNLTWENVGGNGSGECASWDGQDGNLIADPLFCDREAGDFTVSDASPALLHPAGPLGAFPTPGCSTLSHPRLRR